MKKFFVVVALLFLLGGCAKDVRIQRASSLVNVKMTTEAAEYKAAKTPEEKLKVADRHFETMPKFTQLLDDYMHSREPQGPVPAELK